MANIARFRTGQVPEYLESVNTPEYSSDPDCIVNPDISSVREIPKKYWKRVGNTVVAMTTAERNAVDAAEATAISAHKDELATKLSVTPEIIVTALVKLVNQKTRVGQAITKQDFINEVRTLL